MDSSARTGVIIRGFRPHDRATGINVRVWGLGGIKCEGGNTEAIGWEEGSYGSLPKLFRRR